MQGTPTAGQQHGSANGEDEVEAGEPGAGDRLRDGADAGALPGDQPLPCQLVEGGVALGGGVVGDHQHPVPRVGGRGALPDRDELAIVEPVADDFDAGAGEAREQGVAHPLRYGEDAAGFGEVDGQLLEVGHDAEDPVDARDAGEKLAQEVVAGHMVGVDEVGREADDIVDLSRAEYRDAGASGELGGERARKEGEDRHPRPAGRQRFGQFGDVELGAAAGGEVVVGEEDFEHVGSGPWWSPPTLPAGSGPARLAAGRSCGEAPLP